jgi:hypothetical protein
MDNNEAREMDHADNATGPDHLDYESGYFDNQGSWRTRADKRIAEATPYMPRNESDEDAERQYDHCTACGYDLGTHHPTCLRAYGSGNFGNPNRPTGPDYCAGCGRAPCMWTAYSQHYTDPQPHTLERHNHIVMIARIDAMTDSQRRDLLVWFSSQEETMDRGIRFVTR